MSNSTTAIPPSSDPPASVSPTTSIPSSSPTTSPPPPPPSSSSSSSSTTTPPSVTTSTVTDPGTTTTVTPTTTSSNPPPATTTESTITSTNTDTGETQTVVTTVTRTGETTTVTPTNTTSSQTSSTPAPSTLPVNQGNSGGLGDSGKIAIAVIIPVVVVALLLVLGFFLWRKRNARKVAEEQRKNEMAEYGFNPNSDPTLVAPLGAAYTDAHSEPAEDSTGYRGWGTTTSNTRKPSTTMGSNSRGPGGMAFSDNGSQPGGYGYQASPNGASDHYSGDPLMPHAESSDGVAALGGTAVASGAAGAATAARNNRNSQADIHRGPSNASSSYSHGGPRSEVSAEVPYGSPQYHDDTPYNPYSDAPSRGPYGDSAYAGDQPVIRDVQARRNTKIERAPTFPQTQGGIAQNF